jgi:hypothetical protein
MMLEILSLTVICLLAITFLVGCFCGFHRALHEKPSFQVNIRRERGLILDRVEPERGAQPLWGNAGLENVVESGAKYLRNICS